MGTTDNIRNEDVLFEGTILGDYELILKPKEGDPCPRCKTPFKKVADGSLKCPFCGAIFKNH
jgi:Zn finger protein HypA/HybF involved in hydrogenase expression